MGKLTVRVTGGAIKYVVATQKAPSRVAVPAKQEY